MSRRASSSRDARKSSAAPYARSGSGAGSTGLTSYVGDVGLGFDEDADTVPEMKDIGKPQTKKARESLASKAVGAISFRKGKAAGSPAADSTGTMQIEFVKPNPNDIMGITFEAPADHSLKGIVVAQVHDGYLMASLKKLQEGDVLHTINGVAVSTPQQGADQLRMATGTIKVSLTRAGAAPKDQSLFSGISSALSFAHGKGKSKPPPPARAGSADGDPNTTVVVSCSQLIVESKRIVGSTAGLDEKLDALFAALKAKEHPSSQILAMLVDLVGQTTVEQVR